MNLKVNYFNFPVVFETGIYQPALLNELFCRIQLLAELFHLFVVAETLFVILVQLQTLSDVAAQGRMDRLMIAWREE